jgi:hypothetical protein
MKVIVAGSRAIADYDLVADAITSSGFSITEVVSGGAKGVDRLGEAYAERHNLAIRQFKPNWKLHGRGAAFRCNAEMADYAEALIAVHNGSKGTRDMVAKMRSLGKPVHERVIADERGDKCPR